MPDVREDVERLLTMLAQVPGPQMHEVEPPTARDMYRQMGQLTERPPAPGVESRNLAIPGPAGAVPARLYRPEAAPDGTLIVYVHGGGWVIGDLETHHSLCSEIAARTGWPLLAIDYRLAPEHRWPAAVDDTLAAARWAAAHGDTLGVPVERIVIAGDSAGGNLAAIAARTLRHDLPLAAQWLIYPAVDMTAGGGSLAEFAEGYLLTGAAMTWFGRHYGADVTDPRASPLRSDDWGGLPPALVFTCALDPLRDQGRAYAARLVEAGNRLIFREAAGQVHGSLQMRLALPSAQADLEGLIADLKALVG